MKDLIERLEKATGPDRQLDLAINKAVWGDPSYTPVTGSIDAALTLLPKSHTTNVHNGCGEDETFPATYMIRQLHDGYEAFVFYDTYPTWNIEPRELGIGWNEFTPAIALCIAALRARTLTEADRSA